MAYFTHGAGCVPQQPANTGYTHAVFRAFDDSSARAASHHHHHHHHESKPRDFSVNGHAPSIPSIPSIPSTTAAAAAATPFTNPFSNPSQSHVRPLAYLDARADEVACHSSIHPLTLDVAEGLIRMRSSVEPMGAMPRDPPSHLAVTIPAPLPKRDPEPHPLSRPTVSTSSEDNAGHNSDGFSVGENSDTITDPDVDVAEIPFPKALSQPPNAPEFHDLQELATVAARSAGNSESAPSPLPVEHRQIQDATETLSRLVADLQEAEFKHQKLYDPAAPIVPVHDTYCCCRGVADGYLHILNEKEPPSNTGLLTSLYATCRDELCPFHLDAYAKLVTKAIEGLSMSSSTHASQDVTTASNAAEELVWDFDFTVGQTGTGTKWTPGPRRRRRATSIPGIDEFEFDIPPKRRKVIQANHVRSRAVFADEMYLGRSQGISPPAPCSVQDTSRPRVDVRFNEEFRRRVLSELDRGFTDLKEEDWSRGETTNRYLHAILSRCKPPNTDIRRGPIDAGLLSGEEAAVVVEKGVEKVPLFTEGQQQFQWNDSRHRPIAQLFNRMEDLTREVSVQIPSHNFDLPSYQTKSLENIRDRFLSGHVSHDPWNILDLRSPLPPAILPWFLTGENCQLLPRIRDALLEGHSAERTKASREDWNEWTDLLEWVLMSEGGHNTAPHMDSHGWSTWITIQEGHFGFGWLARPTEKEQDAWMSDPLGYTGGKWRYMILKPGQTVFFPSGTIHFVFRLNEEQTLALGGHLLQWTALERWVQVILYQLKNPNITNEDLGAAPLKYIRMARKLVDMRVANSRLGSMGGMPAVTKFMVLCNEVERWYNKKKKKRAR